VSKRANWIKETIVPKKKTSIIKTRPIKISTNEYSRKIKENIIENDKFPEKEVKQKPKSDEAIDTSELLRRKKNIRK
jgi:hypothetical protein